MAKEKLTADLVLEGGGVKGIGLVGALTVLEDQNYEFNRVAGTSAGAIVASFVAAGVSAGKITEQMRSLDYKNFRDETFLSMFGPPGKALSLLINNGIYKGDYVKSWLDDQLASFGVRTFGDLKLTGEDAVNIPPEQAYKLVVVTADLSKGQLVYLPWDFHKYGLDPDIQLVSTAVRASISIPYYYKPSHIGKNTFVDGGVLSNFPIDVFDLPKNAEPKWPTFGIKLSAKENAQQVAHKVTGPLSLAEALVATAMSGHDERHLDNPCTIKRTMFVDTDKIQATNFDITRAQQDFLYANGQKAAREFLQEWDFESYKKTCR
jgi:NTE family protein